MLGCKHVFLLSFLECFSKISRYTSMCINSQLHIASVLFDVCINHIFPFKIEHNHNLLYSFDVIRKYHFDSYKLKGAKRLLY